MKVFKVASDSSCLIALSQINLFHLLKELFLEVYIPPAVYDEVVIKGKGEAEVITLCKELELDYALIDEKMARNMAELMGVNTIGSLGIIELAIEMGFSLDKKEIVKQLKDAGFRISDKLYKKMFLN